MKLLMYALDFNIDLSRIRDELFERRKDMKELFTEVRFSDNLNIPKNCYDAENKTYEARELLKYNRVDKQNYRLAIFTQSKIKDDKTKRSIGGMGSWKTGSSISKFYGKIEKHTIIEDGISCDKKEVILIIGKSNSGVERFLFDEGVVISWHEIFHSLGLGHCRYEKCTMYPAFNSRSFDLCKYHNNKLNKIKNYYQKLLT